jgi:hypothetical protein
MILLRQKAYSKPLKIINFIPKNKEQAINVINKGKIKALEAAGNLNNYVMTHTPGQAMEEIGQKFVTAPVATGGTIAGYASIPFVGYIPGTTWASLSLEAAARKSSVYKKIIENIKGLYTDTPQEAITRLGTGLVKIRDKIYRIGNPSFTQSLMLDNIKREGIQNSEKIAKKVGQILPEQTKGITLKRIVRSTGDVIPNAFI